VDVEAEGPAQKSGLRKGDVVVAVGGSPVRNRLDFNLAALAKFDAGPLPLRIRRGDRTEDVAIAMATAPLSALTRRTFAAQGFSAADVTARLAEEFRLTEQQGAVITAVDKDGAAERIDLRPGDLLYQAGRFRVKNSDELTKILEYYAKDRASVEVMVLRDGRPLRGALPLR
jgi:serine protease Do